MKNVMFREAPVPKKDKGVFDLSKEIKTSCQIGDLVPFNWHDCIPGDRFKMKTEMLAKLSPLLAPVMHRVDIYEHKFFVPYRLLMLPLSTTYAGWEDFITGDPKSRFTNEELPYVTINNTTKGSFVKGSIADYLGLPVITGTETVTQDIDINVLPFYAYHLIYDEYYRDENLIQRVTGHPGGGLMDMVGGNRSAYFDTICKNNPYARAYEKDYFRGALPQAHFGSSSDVELDLDLFGDGTPPITFKKSGGVSPTAGDVQVDASGVFKDSAGANIAFRDGVEPTITAALEIFELRRAQALTRYLEAQNRGGHRYPEVLLGIYGVIPKNQDLDIPQYIGGSKMPVNISSIQNQSQVLDPTAGAFTAGGAEDPITIDPQSLETGKGQGVGRGKKSMFYVPEHGIIMSILSVLPRTAYGGSQIEKFWRKSDRTEFFQPQLQGIGDQEILQSEIGWHLDGTDMDNIFGYAPRWSEYKFKYSTVHSDFLDLYNYWHMATIQDSGDAGPDLNAAFIECRRINDENIRLFANQSLTEDHIYIQIYDDTMAIRPMRVHDIPY